MHLLVKDTGTGIPPDIMDRIFDPYFTTKDAEKGSGIGLTVVQGIVQQHGGFLHVESGSDTGTAFHLYFPLYSEEKSLEMKMQAPLPVGNERGLFVDDEEMLAIADKEMLSLLGYAVTVKTDSLAALKTFRAHPDHYDVVITDLAMPHMSGVDLSQARLHIRPDIPIILCTGHSNYMNESRAKAIGIKEFAVKPLMNRDIALLIRKVMKGLKG